MIVVVILTPSLLSPGANAENAQVITLVALAFALVTAFEYGAKYPGLIEFRDAPPFNRIRIIALFLMLFGLSVIAGVDREGSTLAMVITALGFLVGHVLDFSFSPLRMVVDNLPAGVDPAIAGQVQAMAGLAVLVTIISLFLFSALIRTGNWPNRGTAFNVWVNLPTFDPTAGGDVIKRLVRDGRVNVIFGICSPFVIPAVAVMGANQLQVPILGSSQTMVWAVTLWMFLPLSLVMRGMAMLRIARMIRARRARLVASVEADAPGSAVPS
ncbi:hypothetical protein [Gymnodinialimonas hymeniacidonis]|uniref:hypothetical protein n=1 Tax=Gymnodinialimonas hymeniacidonis TaxID=3126508 RepID=UPI0034C5E738